MTEQDIFMPDCMYARAQAATDEADTVTRTIKLSYNKIFLFQ